MIFTDSLNSLNDDSNKPLKIGSAIIDSDFYIKIADESVYRFLGEFDVFPLTKNVHPDYLDAFTQKVKSLSCGKKDFFTLKLRRTTNISRTTCFDSNYIITEDQYIPVIVFMRKNYADAKNSDFINIQIFHILYLYNCAMGIDNLTSKYGSILSLSDDVYFEYIPNNKKITLFTFKDGTENIFCKGSLDDFCEKLDPLCEQSNKTALNKLIQDIETFTAEFFYIIKSNILSKTGDYEKVSVKGIAINKSPTEKNIIGVIKSSAMISQSDIEFLENKSNIDSLTGLLNKKAITDAIHLKMRSDDIKSLSLVMMDIDYFKDVNDNYGHMFGDEVLMTVAESLKTVIGERGVIGRVGGDEFLIAIENIETENELRSILRSIRSKIEWAYAGRIKITTSLGTATWPKDAENYESLLKLADKCLYIAKAKGRNRFIIYVKEKHGTLSSIDLSSKAISMGPKVSITNKSKHICDVIKAFPKNKATKEELLESVIKTADSLHDYYSYDKCMIFYGDNLDMIYSFNTTEADEKIIDLINSCKYLFDERDMLTVGNYISMEVKNTDMFNYLRDTENYSTIQYLIKDGDIIKGLIVITTYRHANKWSEVDINYLAILFKLISEVLLSMSKV